MGIIEEKIRNTFKNFNQSHDKYEFAKEIAQIANFNIRSMVHWNILLNSINQIQAEEKDEFKMSTEIFDYKVDKIKLNVNELIVQQAREDIKSGKITIDRFSKIKSKYGSHKRLTKSEYLDFPIIEESYTKEGIYKQNNDKVQSGTWVPLLIVKINDKKDVNISLELCEIIGG